MLCFTQSLESIKESFKALQQQAQETARNQRLSYKAAPALPDAQDEPYPFLLGETERLTASRFQQQLSGSWNQRIVDAEVTSPVVQEITGNYVSGDVPESVAIVDCIDVQPADVKVQQVTDTNGSNMRDTNDAPAVSPLDKKAVAKLLGEIDADYSSLRSKLLTLIEKLDAAELITEN